MTELLAGLSLGTLIGSVLGFWVTTGRINKQNQRLDQIEAALSAHKAILDGRHQIGPRHDPTDVSRETDADDAHS